MLNNAAAFIYMICDFGVQQMDHITNSINTLSVLYENIFYCFLESS